MSYRAHVRRNSGRVVWERSLPGEQGVFGAPGHPMSTFAMGSTPACHPRLPPLLLPCYAHTASCPLHRTKKLFTVVDNINLARWLAETWYGDESQI